MSRVPVNDEEKAEENREAVEGTGGCELTVQAKTGDKFRGRLSKGEGARRYPAFVNSALESPKTV
jgi:hypothetical protein